MLKKYQSFAFFYNNLFFFSKKIASEYLQPEKFNKPMKKRKNKKEIDLIDFLEENAEKNDFSNLGTFLTI